MSCALQIYCAPRRSRARGLREWRQERILLLDVKIERTRLITGHHVTGELLWFNHKKHELVVGHLLHVLWSRPVGLTAYPVILGVGVNAEFDRFVGGG